MSFPRLFNRFMSSSDIGRPLVAALFVERDSVYKRIPGVDAWDEERDARGWPGGCAVVAHPPCRLWGQLAHFSKAPAEERHLALWSIELVRRWGGVVEHPLYSSLWRAVGCLSWGVRDSFGGVLVPVAQVAYGHRAQKLTGLYVVGPLPVVRFGGLPSTTVPNMGRAERLATPEPFANFLVGIARDAEVNR